MLNVVDTMKVQQVMCKDGTALHITQASVDHLERHPDIYSTIITLAAKKIKPNAAANKQSFSVNLRSELGEWGKSGKIRSPKITIDQKVLFGRRKGTPWLSRISMAPPKPTSLLKLWIRRNEQNQWELITAYAHDGSQGQQEPLSPDTQYDSAYLRRCLEYWQSHELSYHCANVEGGRAGLYELSYRNILAYHHRLYGGFTL